MTPIYVIIVVTAETADLAKMSDNNTLSLRNPRIMHRQIIDSITVSITVPEPVFKRMYVDDMTVMKHTNIPEMSDFMSILII